MRRLDVGGGSLFVPVRLVIWSSATFRFFNSL